MFSSNRVWLFLLGTPLISSMIVGTAATTGFKQTRFKMYVRDFVQSGSATLLVGLGAFVFGKLRFVVYGYVTSFGLGLLTAMVILYVVYDVNFAVPIRAEVRATLTFAAPVMVMNVFQNMIFWADVVVLSLFVPQKQVGWYQAAYQSSALLLLVLIAINSILPSVMSQLYSDDRLRELRAVYSVATKWTMFVTFLGLVYLIVFRDVVLTLFGVSNSVAVQSLVVLAVGQTVTASVGPAGFLLTMSEYERVETINTIVLAGFNVLLNYLLIQRFGILGAAVATSTSILVLNIVRIMETYIFLGVQPYSLRYWKGAVGVVAASVVLWIGGRFVDRILGAVVIGALTLTVFFLSQIALGLDESDRRLLKEV